MLIILLFAISFSLIGVNLFEGNYVVGELKGINFPQIPSLRLNLLSDLSSTLLTVFTLVICMQDSGQLAFRL